MQKPLRSDRADKRATSATARLARGYARKAYVWFAPIDHGTEGGALEWNVRDASRVSLLANSERWADHIDEGSRDGRRRDVSVRLTEPAV